MKQISSEIKIVEVGPRDGLQFESTILPIEEKIDFINRLGKTGITNIEFGSFVSPKHIPQLADSDQILSSIQRESTIKYSALVPNQIGMNRAVDAGVDSVAVFTAASETFCQKNIGCTVDESMLRFKPVIEIAKQKKIAVRAYISCVFGCPYEGAIKMAQVVRVAKKLYELGCTEISLGDTIGVGTPSQAQTLLLHVASVVPMTSIALHFHDTRGQALANIISCLEMGVTTIDAAIAGLGGCPYALGASGNVATEDVVYMLNGCGVKTGIDLTKLIAVGNHISKLLHRKNTSRVGTAGIPHWIKASEQL